MCEASGQGSQLGKLMDVTQTMAERADALYPRVNRLFLWCLKQNPGLTLDLTADPGAEAQFNAAWLDYVTGGSDEGVKKAALGIVEANKHRGEQAQLFGAVR